MYCCGLSNLEKDEHELSVRFTCGGCCCNNVLVFSTSNLALESASLIVLCYLLYPLYY